MSTIKKILWVVKRAASFCLLCSGNVSWLKKRATYFFTFRHLK